MGMDFGINVDHAGLVVFMVIHLGRTVNQVTGDNWGRDIVFIGDMVLFGNMFMGFLILVLRHLHLRKILGSSWFQLLWPCHIEDNLKYYKDLVEEEGESHPTRQLRQGRQILQADDHAEDDVEQLHPDEPDHVDPLTFNFR